MPYLFFLIINVIFFRHFFSGLVPLPTDALAGVYYPWAAKFWGYVAGIPYKNISLTDVFSQLYPWRVLAMDTIKSGQWPLWNPLSFSGYPLLANWQSAPFYPLNILMLIFGNVTGFSLIVFLQPLLAMSFMYLFLTEIKVSKLSSTLGAIVFAFSGFSMTFLQYATAGHILLWVPLALFFVEKYFTTNSLKYLSFLSLTFFPMLTGGAFQPVFYALLMISFYILFKVVTSETPKKYRTLTYFVGFSLLGCLSAAIQLLPTIELFGRSIRLVDHNIGEYQNGLLPLKNLTTLLAPDFFGNPVTNNFWGFMPYQETSGYFSVVALILCLTGIFTRTHTWRSKLFYFLFFGSALLAFKNPISESVYKYQLPLISTGYASRWLMVTATSAAILSAMALDKLVTKKYFFISLLSTGICLYFLYLTKNKIIFDGKASDLAVTFRNLILPTAISITALFLTFFGKHKNLFKVLLLLLLTFDLLRYAIKFTPFSRIEYSESSNPTFDFIHTNVGIARVSAESGPVLPANTWMYANIQSPSGYDPLVPKNYATYFTSLNTDNADKKFSAQKITSGTYSRYLNINNFSSPLLDLVGNKYVLVLKTKDFKITPEGDYDHGAFKLTKYQPVFTDGPLMVLENLDALPRLKLYYSASESGGLEESLDLLQYGHDFRNKILMDENSPQQFQSSPNDSVQLISYTPNKVTAKATVQNGAYLFLSDNNYPGWSVTVDNKSQKLITAFGVFKAVRLPAGESTISFNYFPDSFKYGLILTTVSLFLTFIFVFKKQK